MGGQHSLPHPSAAQRTRAFHPARRNYTRLARLAHQRLASVSSTRPPTTARTWHTSISKLPVNALQSTSLSTDNSVSRSSFNPLTTQILGCSLPAVSMTTSIPLRTSFLFGPSCRLYICERLCWCGKIMRGWALVQSIQLGKVNLGTGGESIVALFQAKKRQDCSPSGYKSS